MRNRFRVEYTRHAIEMMLSISTYRDIQCTKNSNGICGISSLITLAIEQPQAMCAGRDGNVYEISYTDPAYLRPGRFSYIDIYI